MVISDREAKDLPYNVCGREVEGWRLIDNPQGLGDTFEIYEVWRARSGQLLVKYYSSTPFFAWSDICKGSRQ